MFMYMKISMSVIKRWGWQRKGERKEGMGKRENNKHLELLLQLLGL